MEYYYSSLKMDYNAGKLHCENKGPGWTLASITSQEENDRAYALVGGSSSYSWIGLDRVDPEKWIDGRNAKNFMNWYQADGMKPLSE